MHSLSLGPEDDADKRIVNEFCHLLEKSKQLFNGLRDLPQYGHKQWQAYFGRTFDVYTKLWKFQQQHRASLDAKYGLKRWQIGEIASKIGQLYYHYYLRTSETNYLNEAFSFYSAIRSRSYYSKASQEERSDLMVKKLRYYARFIVVCLLLKRIKMVRDLVRELNKQIDEYTTTYEPEDQFEWSLVLSEIRSFLQADATVNVIDKDSNPVIVSHRLSPHTTPPVDRSPLMHLTLQEILIVGNSSDQVKFSELTIDMFRMLQTLEREPTMDAMMPVYDASPAPGRSPLENGASLKRENPHKYLLYKPTFSQLLVFLASGFKELPSNGALLLYMSADGSFPLSKSIDERDFDYGGVVMNYSKRLDVDHASKRTATNHKEIHCLYPEDLWPFTRRPLFLVVDSENSVSFLNMRTAQFGQSLVILLSPTHVPSQYQDFQQRGRLMTYFLHSPLGGLCLLCGIVDVPANAWEVCLPLVDRFMAEASRLITKSRSIDHSIIHFFGDDFLRVLLLRFVFFTVIVRLHQHFKGRQFQPTSVPAFPENEILDHPSLKRIVLELADHLDSRVAFFSSDSMQ
ncbi:unnamed protein product [Notodromas monacha]|uniref:Protein SCAI n=1 Tax=Notodromas monacha TaxID=399045 RepID=A0A7R9BMH3_9CRUS|nr:unnamed protein product [Notodromas monacha]CAG0917926.1 unnamed protein product [Notodromas monacha]